jgi:hypothetical protein
MKKICLLLSLFLFCAAGAQKIQYSRGTFRSPYPDAVQLVANVDGFHHVVCFTANKKPAVYIFNPQMQYQAKEEVDTKLKENSDIQLLRFENFYLLYLHIPGATKHQLFGINGEGEVKDWSYLFDNPADTAWNRSTASFQLFNVANKLWLLDHTYFDDTKEISSRIVAFTPSFKTEKVTSLSFPFNRRTDILQQVSLMGKGLLVLKTSRDDEKGNLLEVIKADSVGKVLLTTFASGSNLYINPVIRYNASDSTILVSSLLRESFGGRNQRSVLLSQLDYQLHEKLPVTVLKTQFRNNTEANFLLLNTRQPYWLSLSLPARIQRIGNRFVAPDFSEFESRNPSSIFSARSNLYDAAILDSRSPTAVRFTSLNDRLKLTKDSLVANDGSFYKVQPRPAARFEMNGKAYLVLIENFSTKQRGLLLAGNNNEGELTMTSLPVFDRYEYLLPQLQAVSNDYFLVPYTYKNEIGLVKITMTN